MEHFHPCFDELIAHLLTFLPDINNRFPDLLRPHLQLHDPTKESRIILKPGEVADFAYWLPAGYIRTFKEIHHNKDRVHTEVKTSGISSPRKIFLCSNSYMNRTPVDCFVEVTKGSTVVAFARSAFLVLVQEIPEVALLATNIIADAQDDKDKMAEICRVRGLVGYRAFLAAYPDIESYVDLKDIASCIGITAEHLSRIRKKGGFGI